MFKRTLKITAVSLGLLAIFAFAQPKEVQLDVMIRDFPSTAPGFQEVASCDHPFRNDNPNEGMSDNINNPAKGNINAGSGDPTLLNANTRSTFGLVATTLRYDIEGCLPEDVMDDPDGLNREYIKYRYCAYPQKGTASCAFSQQWIESWFDERIPYNDNGDKANRNNGKIIDIMELKLNPESKLYEIIHIDDGRVVGKGEKEISEYEYNWNGKGATGGYFPLDKYSSDPDYADKVFGLENCGIGSEVSWEQRKDGTNWAAQCSTGDRAKHNHNYGFSMSGSGTFKYIKGNGDQFEFIGDDDMYIFIDGILEADIGGIHQAVKATVIMDEVAVKRGWENNTLHSINFFYMDRQTNGSNMVLKMSLTDLSPARFGSPRILEAMTNINNDESSTTIYVSADLNLESIKQHIGKNTFPILVHKPGSKDILGYKLESIEPIGSAGGSKGFMYVITGTLCKTSACAEGDKQVLNTGDSLSFNVKIGDMEDFNGQGFALTDDKYYIKSKSNIPANKLSWARNASTIIVELLPPKPGDPDPLKPEFDMDTWFSGGGSIGTFPQSPLMTFPNLPTSPGHGKNHGGKVSGFGTKGTTVPANKAGEMLLTVYPNTGRSDGGKPDNEDIFGLPPKPDGANLFGVVDPTDKDAVGGGYMFVKNGFPNESSVGAVQIAPTRCTRQTDDPEEPKINCLNFSTMVKQPFKMAVTVYDQLGNFVTQYREEITTDEFRRVVQAPSFYTDYGTEENPTITEADGCMPPNPNEKDPKKPGAFGHPQTLTTNGKVKVGVNIYPFSADGRRFGNGVYLLKVDRVDMPYNGCMSSGNSAVSTTNIFVRHHSDEKFGYMRSKDKK